MQQITADQKDAGARLDVFLSKILNLPRNKARKLITEKLVSINTKNTKAVKPSYVVKSNDLIEISNEKKFLENLIEKTPPEIPIIFEDDNILVINKTRGI